jgi:DnaJ domain
MFSKSAGPLCVEITLESGDILKGKFLAPPGRTLMELLNTGTPFVEFEPFGDERTFLAKASLRQVKSLNMPPNPTLKPGGKDFDGFDPHAVLGIAAGADKEEVHRAYLHLAKIYHPDRYAAAELPPEVIEYLAAMARRINAAHDTLEAAQRDKPAPVARQAPVFTTPGRS